MNRVYIAARLSRLLEIKEFAVWLESQNFEIAFRWWNQGEFNRPYRNSNNPELNASLKASIAHARDADTFILFSEPGMRGAYVELGAFLADESSHKQTYVVGGGDQDHIFEALDGFVFVKSTEELKEILNA